MADESKQIGPAPEQAGEAPPQPHSAETFAFMRLKAWLAFLNDMYTGWGNRWAAPAAELSK